MPEPLQIGGLGPLSRPGIPSAGEDLRDGMQLAVDQVNEAGGLLGRALQLAFADTKGVPTAGVRALEELRRRGVRALVGEFHSAVADAIVEPSHRARLPFICASATLDAITSRRLPNVFRLAPPQSYGWRAYAEFVAAEGFRHVVALLEESVYWRRGCEVIEARLRAAGVRLTRLTVEPGQPARLTAQQVERLTSSQPPADLLLLLIGYPEPLQSLAGELRAHGLVPPLVFWGEPAGRAIFPDWWDVAGREAVGVPFLAYTHPRTLSPEGRRAARAFLARHGREPSFVALEGYDAVLALAAGAEAARSLDAERLCAGLRQVTVAGTRGPISFATEPAGVVHQQWRWPPVYVVAHRHPRQRFADAEVLWDAAAGRAPTRPQGADGE